MATKTKEKPIIFSTPLIPAIQNLKPNTWPPEPIDPGKPWKYMTRRVIKPQPQRFFEVNEEPLYLYDVEWNLGSIYPKYQPGDILWVRETFTHAFADTTVCGSTYTLQYQYIYKADKPELNVKWRPSRFMPKAAARLFLEVKSARAERVQAITGLDCVKEGVAKTMESLDEALCDFCPLPKELQGIQGIPSGYTSCEGSECSEAYKTYLEESAIDEFADIWDELYAKRGYPWESNPWVWVYEFGRVDRP